MKRKASVWIMIFLAMLSLAACRPGKETQTEAPPDESAEPLTVEAGGLDLDALRAKTADEIRETDGYYLQQSVSRQTASEADWNKALEPFGDTLALRLQDDSFTFDGKEELTYMQMYRDKSGYVYVSTSDKLLLFDPEGNALTQKQYGSEGFYIGEPIVSDAGDVIFPVKENMGSVFRIVSFDRGTGEERVLGEAEDRYFRDPLCALRGSKLFYRSDDWIISWDLVTGARERFFDLKNVGAGDRSVVMGFDADGAPLLYVGGKFSYYQYSGYSDDEELVAVLGSQPPAAELTIRICDLKGAIDNGFVASGVGAYRVRRQDVGMDYQTYEDDREGDDYRARIMAEITGGNSPDILCVGRDDLQMLWQKGALADMEEILSQDTRDALLPGALELCMVDGEMAGVVPVVYATALATSAQDWNRDSWTLQEFMEQTVQQGKKYAWVGANGMCEWSSAHDIMQLAGIPGMESMGLIDRQACTARLDGEEYIEWLNFCKEYGMERALTEDEYEVCIQNRESMATAYGFLYSYGYYENYYKLYGEDCNVIGFPGGAGCNYLNGVKWLAVSKQAAEDPKKKEAVSAVLEYLLSEEEQSHISYYLGVRRPTEENCYEIRTEEEETVREFLGEDFSRQIVCVGQRGYASMFKPDGTTYLKEFTEFLENCKGFPYVSSDISKIILEEAGVFFQGGRSAEETARITQNRVQLYLNEK